MMKLGIYKDGSVIGEYKHDGKSREITIGRAPGCSVRLDDPAVSRLHSVIIVRDKQWVIEKKTSGGTLLINGLDVQDAPLTGGEEITINMFSLRVELPEQAQASATGGSGHTNNLAAAGAEVEGDRTRFASVAVSPVFRFEPGSASVTEFLMKGDLAVFGRASNCDVILTDKKASRKHLEIRRQGLSFFIKDLNSANGTLLNGAKLAESELSPGDQIEVGENKFSFSIENKDYFENKDQFMPVPANLAEAAPLEDDSAYNDQALVPGQAYLPDPNFSQAGYGQSQDGAAADFAANANAQAAAPEKSILKRFWVWYKAQPPFRRYLVIFLVLALGGALFGEDQVKKKKAAVVKRDANGKKIRTYETLSKEKQAIVKKAYADLLLAHEKRDYAKMLDEIGKITALLDEYKELKFFATRAKEGIAEQERKEEERKKKERQEAIARAVEALENKGKPVFEKAMKNPSARPELRMIIQEIIAKSPGNSMANEWTAAIKRKEEEEEQDKKVAEEKRKLREKAEGEFKKVEQTFAANKYVEAIAESDLLPNIGYDGNNYLDRVKKLKANIQAKLASVVNPILQEAADQRKEGGDLVKANEFYKKVLAVEPENKTALAGMEAIRAELHRRAKRMYADALLAESISELAQAKDLFAQCERTAPDNDMYKARCKNKLSKYEVLR